MHRARRRPARTPHGSGRGRPPRPGSPGAVNLEQGRGLLGVDAESDPDGVLVVVGPALDLGPLEQPGHDLVDIGQQRDHGVQRPAVGRQLGVQSPDLGDRTGVAVQQEAVLAVGLSEPGGHDRVGEVVADVAAGVHDGPQLVGQRCLGGLHGPEDVSGRDRRNVVVLRDQAGLRALARTGRAHDEKSHQRRNPS